MSTIKMTVAEGELVLQALKAQSMLGLTMFSAVNSDFTSLMNKLAPEPIVEVAAEPVVETAAENVSVSLSGVEHNVTT